jgi:hypothetical protein
METREHSLKCTSAQARRQAELAKHLAPDTLFGAGNGGD